MLSHDFYSLVFMSGVPFFIHCPKIAAAAAAATTTFFGLSQRMENLVLSSEGVCACFQVFCSMLVSLLHVAAKKPTEPANITTQCQSDFFPW